MSKNINQKLNKKTAKNKILYSLATVLFVCVIGLLSVAIFSDNTSRQVDADVVRVIPPITGTWQDDGFVDRAWFDNFPNRGTATNPFLIGTPQELAGLARLVNGVGNTNSTTAPSGVNAPRLFLNQHIRITANIDLTYPDNRVWIAIGGNGAARGFRGTLDGNFHTITLPSNIRSAVNQTSGDRGWGLFGHIGANSTIRNITVAGDVTTLSVPSGTMSNMRVGGITGIATGNARVEHAESQVNFNITQSTDFRFGGIVGVMVGANVTLTHLVNSGNITLGNASGTYLGGIFGLSWDTGTSFFVTNAHNSGNITVGQVLTVGGIGGAVDRNGNIINSYNWGNIHSTSAPSAASGGIGGILGDKRRALSTVVNITNVYNYGLMTGSATRRGQILGNLGGGSAVLTDAFGLAGTGAGGANIALAGSGGILTAGRTGHFDANYILTSSNFSGEELYEVMNDGVGRMTAANQARSESWVRYDSSNLPVHGFRDQWITVPNLQVTLTLNYNLPTNNVTREIILNPGESITVGSAAFANAVHPEGNNFYGWTLNQQLADFGFLRFPPGSAITVAENRTLFATWLDGPIFTDPADILDTPIITVNHDLGRVEWAPVYRQSPTLVLTGGTPIYRVTVSGHAPVSVVGANHLDLTSIIATPGTFTVSVIAVGDGFFADDSLPAITTITSSQLATPTNISVSNQRVVSWNTVIGADEFVVSINDQEIIVPASTTSINLLDQTTLNNLGITIAENVFYTIRVVARSSSRFIFDSESVAATPFRVVRLATPVVNINAITMAATWNSIAGSSGYNVYHNGSLVATTNNSYFELAGLNLPVGTHDIEVVAMGDGNIFFLDSVAGEASVEVTRLTTPNLAVEFIDGEYRLTWNSVTNAKQYQIRVQVGGGSFVYTYVDASVTSAALSDLGLVGGGNIAIRVVAMADDLFRLDSLPAELTRGQLASPVINISDTHLLTWNAITGANSYIVTLANLSPQTVMPNGATLSLQLDLSTLALAAFHRVTVVAVSSDPNTINAEPVFQYIFLPPAPLPTPIVSISENFILSFSSSGFAHSYEIRINGALVSTVAAGNTPTIRTLDISSFLTAVGTHQISVLAIAPIADPTILDSEVAGTVSVTINRLATPVVSLNNSNMTMSWSAIPNASFYRVLVNGTIHQIATTSFDLSTLNLGLGDHSAVVYAIGDGFMFLVSEQSNVVNFAIARLAAPSLTLNQKMLTWIAVPNATGYRVVVNGQTATTTNLYFDLASLALGVGSYNIRVYAIADNLFFLDSIAGTSSVTVTQLAVPNATFNNQNMVVSWNAISGVSLIRIIVDGQTIDITDGSLSFDLSAIGLATGSFTVRIYSIGDNVLFLSSSAWVHHFTVASLATPNPTLNSSMVLSWTAVANATNYRVTVGSQYFYTTNLSFDLSTLGLSVGTHNISVQAMGDGFLFINSIEWTHSFTITQLTRPILDLDYLTLSWNTISNATGYRVYVNGIFRGNVATTTFDLASLDLGLGSHSVVVYAVGDGFKFVSSIASLSMDFQIVRLDAPNISLSQKMLTWDAVADATSYRIVIGSQNFTTTNLYFDLAALGLGAGTHNIRVYAIADNLFFLDSTAATNTITIVQLSTPTVTFDSQNMIVSWNAVSNASLIRIVVDGQTIDITDGSLSFDLSTLGLNVGTHTIRIYAIGDDILFLSSSAWVHSFGIGLPTPTPTPTPTPDVTPEQTPTPEPTPEPPYEPSSFPWWIIGVVGGVVGLAVVIIVVVVVVSKRKKREDE